MYIYAYISIDSTILGIYKHIHSIIINYLWYSNKHLSCNSPSLITISIALRALEQDLTKMGL